MALGLEKELKYLDIEKQTLWILRKKQGLSENLPRKPVPVQYGSLVSSTSVQSYSNHCLHNNTPSLIPSPLYNSNSKDIRLQPLDSNSLIINPGTWHRTQQHSLWVMMSAAISRLAAFLPNRCSAFFSCRFRVF